MSEKPTVAVIGLGNMGGGMARTLVRAGYSVRGFDVAESARDRSSQAGVQIEPSAVDAVRGAAVLFTVLPDSPDVRACYLGDRGIAAGLAAGTLCVDCSTIEPAVTDQIAAHLETVGCSLVDAALGRSPAEAEAGTLLFMVGGADADLRRLMPLLDALGDQTEHCGPTGSGIRTKLVLNLLSQSTCQLSAEVVALGLKMGLQQESLLNVLGAGLGANGFITRYWPTKVLKGDTEPGFAIRLSAKDLRHAVAMASEARAPIPTGTAAAQAVNAAVAAHGDLDVSGLLVVACENAGTDLKS